MMKCVLIGLLVFMVMVSGCSKPVVEGNETTVVENETVEIPFELRNIQYLGSTAFKVEDIFTNSTIYFNPYNLKEGMAEADIILITNPNEGRCSAEDVGKISTSKTVILTTADCLEKLRGIEGNLTEISPQMIRKVRGNVIIATPAYNLKPERGHPEENGWVGFFVKANRIFYYHAGDTDFVPIMKQLGMVHIAMLPIGGDRGMDIDEAINATLPIDAHFSVPMDYLHLENADELERRWMEEVEFGFPAIIKGGVISWRTSDGSVMTALR